VLANEPHPEPGRCISVVEPACGSANDYRFLHEYGVARLIDYTGFDLCTKNIANARALFPSVKFERGNVFELSSPDKAFDCCIVQDLFEHLSLEGLERAVEEVCRITCTGICAGFFQMDEIREHVVRAVDDYHWNLLSMARMRKLFAARGFAGQVLHMDSFLRQKTSCQGTHNPNAYSFVLGQPSSSRTQTMRSEKLAT
jgi:SAM-dependent methyltransferase